MPSTIQRRSLYARTNNPRGFKDNTPDGWVSTNGPVWWVGSDNAYAMLQPRRAGMSAITRAINIIASPIASADWSIDGSTPRWVSDPMLCRPDERFQPTWPASMRVPRSTFWGAWIRSAISWGMGYLIFIEDASGGPLAGSLGILHPERVESAPYGGGFRRIGTPGAYVDTDAEGRYRDEGIWWRLVELRNQGTPLDPATGTTPGTLEYHAAEFGLMDAQLHYAAGMYSGGGVPSGYLKIKSPQITPDHAVSVQSNWETAHGSGMRRTAVLGADVDYEAIAVSPVDAALADMKRLSLVDVANAFGIPGYMIGAPEGSSMTYSNVEMQLKALYEFTLRPWAVAIEETLSALLPGSTTLKITPSGERRVSDAGTAVPGSESAPVVDLRAVG